MASASGRKVVVVTGGSGGVGRAIVREFAAAGYDVAVLARGRAGIEAAAKDASNAGAHALSIPTDTSDHDAVEAAAHRVEQELGEIDVWVNCAFTGFLAKAWDVTPEEFHRVTDVTYHGYVHGTLAALRRFRPRNRGVVIQVGSALAYRGIPLQAAYCGAKHAIVGFTESVITELRSERSRVRVCMVELPGVNTTQFNWVLNKMPKHPMPVPPIYQPEIPARAVVAVAARPRRNLWVGATTAGTILGNRVAPWLLDWYLGRTGVQSQQTDQDAPAWRANLFEPADDEHDRGSHGAFDAKAHARSPFTWLALHKAPALGATALAATVAAAAARRRAD